MEGQNQIIRRKWQRHNWPELIQKWKGSGLNQVQFCKENDLNPTTFSTWKRQGEKPSSGFIRLPQSFNSGLLNSAYEIILPGNIRIRVDNHFDPVSLKHLIKVVQEL